MDRSKAKQVLLAASAIQEDARQLVEVTRQLAFDPVAEAQEDLTLFDALITEDVLRDTTRQLFVDGHYALAVEEAFKCLNNVVKARSRLTTDGADLMRNAFTPKSPVLRLNALKTESQRNHQLGYMEILAGCMTGIRNPRAHEHRHLDEPRVALEMLSLANHLLRLVGSAKRSSPKRSRGKV
jgi:uncharacterized protein (TIGR02391 family)